MRKVLALVTLLILVAISLAAFQSGSVITGGGVRISGSPAANDCLKFVSANTITTAGAACGTGAGGVTSFNTRTGAVLPAAADYGLGDIGNPAAGTSFTYATDQNSSWVMQGTGTFGVTGPITASTSVTSALYKTTTNCAATGTSASPSLVACSAAASGAFSCAVTASGATCVISTTAVTANSRIFVQESAAEGANIGVTCNTAPSVVPAILLSAKSAGTSFTINMPTIASNPACFVYWIVN